MNCNEAMQRLGAYHDGELSVADAEAVSQHCRDCPACRGELDRIRRADAALGESAQRAAARFDPDRLVALVDRRIGRRRRWPIVAAAAAGLLLAATLAVTFWPADRDTQRAAGVASPQPLVELPLPPAATYPPPRARSFPPPGRVELSESPPMLSAAPEPGSRPIGPGRLPAWVAATPAPPANEQPAARIEPFPAQPSAVALRPPARPGEMDVYDRLLRRIEIALTEATMLSPDRSDQWLALSDRIRAAGLIERVRAARRALPAGSEPAKLLAAAEAMLTRLALAATMADEAAAVQHAIRQSDILDRCRELRA